ncbi:hypothetical protein BDV95DRAFT_622083 [Massariosphaeria phaeospora]|uniref:Uncharacterized protein n=1 Tax=Massariosphaeria phaeospora TaxID=100035 RepID=A0A7C8I0V4_9PLEO|nr:hypothetical protein BDV95DRAFT_622083 [Massariosphaeria phaeospora]
MSGSYLFHILLQIFHMATTSPRIRVIWAQLLNAQITQPGTEPECSGKSLLVLIQNDQQLHRFEAPYAKDPKNAERLWALSEKLVKSDFKL